MKKKKTEKKKLGDACDDLWAFIVKARAENTCEVPDCYETNCDAHHLENRRLNVRWDLETGICLCKSHHTFGNISAHSTSQDGQHEFHKILVEIYGTEFLEDIGARGRLNRKWGLVELRELKQHLKDVASRLKE